MSDARDAWIYTFALFDDDLENRVRWIVDRKVFAIDVITNNRHGVCVHLAKRATNATKVISIRISRSAFKGKLHFAHFWSALDTLRSCEYSSLLPHRTYLQLLLLFVLTVEWNVRLRAADSYQIVGRTKHMTLCQPPAIVVLCYVFRFALHAIWLWQLH